MKKYISPVYCGEEISVNDIVLSSPIEVIKDAGTGSVGTVSGDKGVFENDFNKIF